MGLVVFESGISIDLIWIVIPQDAAERTLREGVGWCLRVSRTRMHARATHRSLHLVVSLGKVFSLDKGWQYYLRA